MITGKAGGKGACVGFAGNRGPPTDEDKLGRFFTTLQQSACAGVGWEGHVLNALFLRLRVGEVKIGEAVDVNVRRGRTLLQTEVPMSTNWDGIPGVKYEKGKRQVAYVILLFPDRMFLRHIIYPYCAPTCRPRKY